MRSFRFLGVLLLTGVLVAGCDFFEQRDRTFDDDPKLEFFPLSETVDESDAEDAGGTVTVETSIQLIGRQRDSELPINYTVVDTTLEAEGAEAAEEGTHFTLPATSATIAANSSSAPVEVNVLDNNMDDGNTNYVLFLRLQEDNEVEPAENLKTFTLTIRGADESNE
jgi:hypothetical protein